MTTAPAEATQSPHHWKTDKAQLQSQINRLTDLAATDQLQIAKLRSVALNYKNSRDAIREELTQVKTDLAEARCAQSNGPIGRAQKPLWREIWSI